MTRYDEPPASDGMGGPHPLAGVPQEALNAARAALYHAGYHGEDGTEFHLDPDELTSVAEGVLAAAMPIIRRTHRRKLAELWSMQLSYMLEQQMEDGTPVMSIVFAHNPELKQRLYRHIMEVKPR